MNMKRILYLSAAALILAACSPKDYMDASLSPETRTRILLSRMTLEEKIGQMCQYVGPCYVEPGHGSPYKNIDAADENLGNADVAERVRGGLVGSFLHVLTSNEAVALQEMARQSRLKIPLLLGVDAIHGNGLIAGCTVYPTNIGMASSFDPEMMERIGAETASEMRYSGICWTFAPNLDVSRDARWGRTGETFGEDPYLVSQMGKYSIWGLQGRDGYGSTSVMACAKHLIAGGEPAGGINAAPMDVSERKLRETYLPPFEAAVREANVGTVMAAHNEINGIPCHGNSWILQDILRDELGFDGFVVSDWMDIERMHLFHRWLPSLDEAFKVSVEAGIDMHMQGDKYFESILDGVRSGRISEKRIDQAAGAILLAKFRLGLFEHPVPELRARGAAPEGVEEHRATALEAARESIVLLKNDGVLPLASPRRIFVCGPNADSQTILGDWAVPQADDDVITALEGIRALCADAAVDAMCFDGMIEHIDDDGIAQAARRAAAADVNILVLGENTERYSPFGRTTGENCDRDNLDFPGRQQELLERVCAAGKPTVLVLLNGRPLSVVWAQEHVDAIVEAWEPGMLGGQAIAEILTGKVNPSGKLPVTVPWNVGQIQTCYSHKPMQYSRKFVWTHTGCLYPFGFGLSYTTFEYGDPVLSADRIGRDGSATVSFTLTNTGSVDGTETAQLYIRDDYASVTRPVKELKGFRRVALKAGESAAVEFEITPDMLKCWGADECWSVEPGTFTVMVGSSSDDADLKTLTLEVQ